MSKNFERFRIVAPPRAWGGGQSSFNTYSQQFRETSLITTSPVALQAYLTGLGVGCLSTFFVDSSRTGGKGGLFE